MALEVRGQSILTQGEFIALSKGALEQPASPTLAKMWLGEEVEPMDAYSALSVDARMAAGANDALHGILDRATARLRRAFPAEVPA